MAKKYTARKPPAVAQRLGTIERLVRNGFRQVDRRFEQSDRRMGSLELEMQELKRNMNEGFAVVDERIDRLATHVDGFIKLHETLDIEFKVIKEQMSRMEARLDRLEAARTT